MVWFVLLLWHLASPSPLDAKSPLLRKMRENYSREARDFMDKCLKLILKWKMTLSTSNIAAPTGVIQEQGEASI